MARATVWTKSTHLLAACSLVAASSAPSVAQAPVPYQLVDRVEGPNVMFNVAPVRPMTIHEPTNSLWYLNTHDSTVSGLSIVPFIAVPARRLPWGPVAVATWHGESSELLTDDELLIVCRGTWALVRMNLLTGEFVGLTRLLAEPSDILVDQDTHRAFVSCMGEDSVLEIDLMQNSIDPVRIYDEVTEAPSGPEPGDLFQIKSPYFLSFDPDPVSGEKRILVAPLHSGNNSTVLGPSNSTQPNGSVVDLADPSQAITGLPDSDLYRITPSAAPGSAVERVATGMGTILFAHGIHPTTGEFWQLNTEANNKNPMLQSEPAVKGNFVFNRITKIPTPFGAPSSPSCALPQCDFISLDPPDVAMGEASGQPFGLAFHPTNGDVYVCGMLTDNVWRLNSDGTLDVEWDLPEGVTIPRGIITWSIPNVTTFVATYCWGSNTIVFSDADSPTPAIGAVSLPIGHDPTPSNIKEGREIFFDGANSELGNASCASCHVDGGTDFLAWNLSNDPKDDKGPMVTQTLVGLERLEPFHWRGERLLEDFNGAFVGLLGNDEPLTGTDFQLMKDYLFALKNPANPNQTPVRLLDPTIHFQSTLPGGQPSPEGNAVAGQIAWSATPSFSLGSQNKQFTCNTCHSLPNGTNNDIINDSRPVVPNERSHFKSTPFHELWRKEQSLVSIQRVEGGVPQPTEVRAFLGAGTGHAGLTGDIFRFVDSANTTNVANQVDFVHQWDQGVGRAVHYSYLLEAGSPLATNNLQGYLQGQLDARNCDAVVMGTTFDGDNLVPMRWYWDRFADTPAYVPEDPTFAITSRQAQHFLDGAEDDGEVNLFVGLPVGMGERFGVDYDSDGIYNAPDAPDELVPLLADASDTMAPGFESDPTIDWITTRVARVRFDTDEVTTAVVEFTDTETGQTITATSDVPGKTHAVIVSGLRGSTPFDGTNSEFLAQTVSYDWKVTATDLAAPALSVTFDSVQVPLPPEETLPFAFPDVGFDELNPDDIDHQMMHEHIVRELALDLTDGQGVVDGAATVNVAFKLGQLVPDGMDLVKPPAPRRLVIARVMHQPFGTEDVNPISVTPGANTLEVDIIRLSTNAQNPGPPGPYLVNQTLTGSTGEVVLNFTTPAGLVNANDKLFFNIEGVVEIRESEAAGFQTTLNTLNCSSTCGLILPVPNNDAYSQWDFPTTKEENACVSATFAPGP